MTTVAADVICLIDESGSMHDMGPEPLQALNLFITKQKQIDSSSLFTLYTFNTESRTIYKDIPLSSVGEFKDYVPNGTTALYDCISLAISDKMATGRCKNTVLVIITDGKDNASKVTLERTKELIASQEKDHNWQVIYLAANQNAFESGSDMNIKAQKCANFSQRPGDLLTAVRQTSDSVGQYRLYSQQMAEPPEIQVSPLDNLQAIPLPLRKI